MILSTDARLYYFHALRPFSPVIGLLLSNSTRCGDAWQILCLSLIDANFKTALLPRLDIFIIITALGLRSSTIRHNRPHLMIARQYVGTFIILYAICLATFNASLPLAANASTPAVLAANAFYIARH